MLWDGTGPEINGTILGRDANLVGRSGTQNLVLDASRSIPALDSTSLIIVILKRNKIDTSEKYGEHTEIIIKVIMGL